MKVLTLNTWQERGPWKERWEIIFQGIRTLQPDLVFFQEIFSPVWVKEIAKCTALKNAVYHDAASGLALFSSFPLLDSGSRMLKGQSVREEYRRYLLYGKFQSPAGIFYAWNTHLSWMLEDTKVRGAQTAEIAEIVREIAGPDESVIAGDFNTVAWAPEIRDLTENQGFQDVYKTRASDLPGLTWTYDNVYTREGRHPLPDRRIDYIFTCRAAKLFGKPKTARVVFDLPGERGVLASDHYGVYAEFENT